MRCLCGFIGGVPIFIMNRSNQQLAESNPNKVLILFTIMIIVSLYIIAISIGIGNSKVQGRNPIVLTLIAILTATIFLVICWLFIYLFLPDLAQHIIDAFKQTFS